MNEIMTYDEWMDRNSKLTKLQNTLSADGAEEPRRAAAEILGFEEDPIITGPEYLSILSRNGMRFNKDKIAETKANRPVPVQADTSAPLTEIYENWCVASDHVAGDNEIAHFVGVTAPAVYYARRKLMDAGYIFDKNGTGWNIIRPEEQKEFTKSDMVRAVEIALKQLRQS